MCDVEREKFHVRSKGDQMKKLLSFGGMFAGAVLTLAAVAMNVGTPVSAAPNCTAESEGPRGSAFTINGNQATVKFKVKGQENCKVQLSAMSFYAPSMTGKPYNEQTKFDITTKTYGPGTYSLSVSLPPKSTKAKGCFYQVDLTYGTKIKSPVIAYGHGKLNCGEKEQPKPIKVCDLKTKKPITIKENEFDRKKHSRNFDDCKTKPTPQEMEVCVIKTGETKNIKKNEFNKNLHTTDFTKCEDTPVTVKEEGGGAPVEETPEALPETGPAQVAMQMLGMGSMVASAGYYLQSRRSL